MHEGLIRNQRIAPAKKELSRKLRRDMTQAEKVFWHLVRGRKLFGLKFRRQQIIDGFIIDFYCDSLKLCVEIDGDVHDSEEQERYDEFRDQALALRGLATIRFSNEEIIQHKNAVIEKLYSYIDA